MNIRKYIPGRGLLIASIAAAIPLTCLSPFSLLSYSNPAPFDYQIPTNWFMAAGLFATIVLLMTVYRYESRGPFLRGLVITTVALGGTTAIVHCLVWMGLNSRYRQLAGPLPDLGASLRGSAKSGWRVTCKDPTVDDVRFAKWLPHLRSLDEGSNIVALVLAGSKITDKSMIHVYEFANGLSTLDLANTAVGDAGIAKLRGLDVFVLKLKGTKVTNQSLRHLATMRRLRCLDLSGTDIDDGVLEYLRPSEFPPSLSVNVSNTKVSKASIKVLERRGFCMWYDNMPESASPWPFDPSPAQ